MKVKLEMDLCIGAGQCVRAAPTIFGQDDDEGLVFLHKEPSGVAEESGTRQAARLCPAQAIVLESQHAREPGPS